MPISPRQTRSAGSAATASQPAAKAATKPSSSMAGPAVKSATGCSRSRAWTARSTATARQSWLTAAPPAAKFATICAVTEAGKAETPRAATPWLPAKTMARIRSARGGCRPCHVASQSASSSSRPSAPGGLVSCGSRAAAAAAAVASAPGHGRETAVDVVHGGDGGGHEASFLFQRPERLAYKPFVPRKRREKRRRHRAGGSDCAAFPTSSPTSAKALRAAAGFLTRLPVAHGRRRRGLPGPRGRRLPHRRRRYRPRRRARPIRSPPRWRCRRCACALAALAAVAVLSGALHEDGLADFCDGIGGGQRPPRPARIMRDSHNGTFGTLALVLGVGLRASLIAAVAAAGRGHRRHDRRGRRLPAACSHWS